MKSHSLSVLLMATVLATGSAQADTIASYASGVSPTAGTTGSADPTTQGWVASTGSPGAFNYGADSSVGGWRITDGTSGAAFFYSVALTGDQATDLVTQDWTATWTSALVGDAVNLSGLPDGVDDFYSSVPTRQNNNAMWIEVGGTFRYILTHTADANGDVQISDGISTYQITSLGTQMAEELGTGAPGNANYVTYTLAYDAGAGTATLSDSLGGSHGVVNQAGTGSQNRLVWGATSSGGMGSTAWNEISVDVIPEPGTLALVGLPLLVVLIRRFRA